jgi:hypothetical protein
MGAEMTETRTTEQMFFDGKDGKIAEVHVVLYPDTEQLIATVDQDKAAAGQFKAAMETHYPDHNLKQVHSNGAGFWFVYGRKADG